MPCSSFFFFSSLLFSWHHHAQKLVCWDMLDLGCSFIFGLQVVVFLSLSAIKWHDVLAYGQPSLSGVA